MGAITDNPARVGSVFATIERIAKSLTLGKVQLWPRFHVDIARTLNEKPAEVRGSAAGRSHSSLDSRPSFSSVWVEKQLIEAHQLLSDNMKDIQNALIKVVGACVSELKRSTTVELNDFSVEHLLFRPLDDIIQRQLNPVWHITPKKTKQLVYDLRTLRALAQELVSQDSISFLKVRITGTQRFRHVSSTKENPEKKSDSLN